MTTADEVTEVRARLERMVDVAESANAVEGLWARPDGSTKLKWAPIHAFVAAASPDLLLRVARKDLSVLDRHAVGNWNDCLYECGGWPCPEVTAVLRAWLP